MFIKRGKMAEPKLNLDIAGAVSELETLLKRVLPKNIMYQIQHVLMIQKTK